MRHKGSYVGKLIWILFMILFLLNALLKTPHFLNRIIILPFLLCSIMELVKIVFLFFNKPDVAKLFHKLYIIIFLCYWFGFLGYWCYASFQNQNYLSLLFSIPFWLVGIKIVKKFFLKQEEKTKKKKPNDNFKVIIGSLLVGICLLSGIVMLFFGIKDTYELKKRTKNYLTTNGYFNDYEIYGSNEEETTYRLLYRYEVENQEYIVKTDYGTSYIPEENSIRKVKYNPEYPEESILIGTNRNNSLIYMGAFFTLGSFAFILGACSFLGYFDKFKIDVLGTYFGIVFFVVGIGILLFQTGTTGSLLETIKSFGFWTLIPFMFIVVGILQTGKCLFDKRKQEN